MGRAGNRAARGLFALGLAVTVTAPTAAQVQLAVESPAPRASDYRAALLKPLDLRYLEPINYKKRAGVSFELLVPANTAHGTTLALSYAALTALTTNHPYVRVVSLQRIPRNRKVRVAGRAEECFTQQVPNPDPYGPVLMERRCLPPSKSYTRAEALDPDIRYVFEGVAERNLPSGAKIARPALSPKPGRIYDAEATYLDSQSRLRRRSDLYRIFARQLVSIGRDAANIAPDETAAPALFLDGMRWLHGGLKRDLARHGHAGGGLAQASDALLVEGISGQLLSRLNGVRARGGLPPMTAAQYAATSQ